MTTPTEASPKPPCISGGNDHHWNIETETFDGTMCHGQCRKCGLTWDFLGSYTWSEWADQPGQRPLVNHRDKFEHVRFGTEQSRWIAR